MDNPDSHNHPEIQLMKAIESFGSRQEIEKILIAASLDNQNLNLCQTILHETILVCFKSDCMLDVLLFFLENKFFVDAKNKNGQTPLIFALANKIKARKVQDIVHLLLNFGADPDARDKRGQTALHHVIHGINALGLFLNENSCQLQIAKWCIKSGANINAQRDDGQTPLHLACDQLDRPMIEFLLVNGAEVNVRDEKFNTPLHFLARYNYPEDSYKVLLRGANINSKNVLGRTPLHLAVQQNNDKVVKFLLEYGADINEVDDDENTPASWKSPQGFTFSRAISSYFYNYFDERETAGLSLIPANREVMKRLAMQLIFESEEWSQWSHVKNKSLLKELERMKSDYVDSATTVYDILRKSDCTVMNFAENSYLARKIFLGGEYPIYSMHIKAKLCRVALRKVMMGFLNDYFLCFDELNFPLPCIERIFECFTIGEICDLLRVSGVRNISDKVKKKLIKWFDLEVA